MKTRATPHPVRYPVRRSAFLAGCGVALCAAVALCLVLWAASVATMDAQGGRWHALAWGLWLVGGVGVLRLGLRPWQGHLAWDGQQWSLEPFAGVPCAAASAPAVALDLQNRLWLYVPCQGGGVRWLWLERAFDPARWLELRRAVYSRAKSHPMDAPAGGRMGGPEA